MSEVMDTARDAQRSRMGPVIVIALIAFAIGLGLMAYAMRDGLWGRTSTPTAAPSPAPAPITPDLATLALREAALAAQLANLEARAARIDGESAQAEGHAGRAEAILITFAARRALERGVGLGYLEGELRRRFGASFPREVNNVIRNARTPVTLEDLREGLNAAAPTLLATQSDWWAGIGSELRSLVVIHRAGTPSPLPSDRLARARRQLGSGNVETALAEVERLPGAANAGNWTAAARRYVEARAALDSLESAAITGAATAAGGAIPPAAAPDGAAGDGVAEPAPPPAN
ncbi:hypothetical protein [Sphingomonas sp. BK235]|uniref:hypothetical protein n=1 Tax=Sphingomonas sp. BK235 TaxID=2512131 RepID=UPI0010DECFCC|nr:hypothetical protein [Sphingomonas sp. BK235]TCP35538.1 hypothetical protein EV292_102123 [Sphingomonas sp. BK235]